MQLFHCPLSAFFTMDNFIWSTSIASIPLMQHIFIVYITSLLFDLIVRILDILYQICQGWIICCVFADTNLCKSAYKVVDRYSEEKKSNSWKAFSRLQDFLRTIMYGGSNLRNILLQEFLELYTLDMHGTKLSGWSIISITLQIQPKGKDVLKLPQNPPC